MYAQFLAWVTKWAVALIAGAVVIVLVVSWWVWHNHQIAVNAAAPAKAQVQVDKAKNESAHDAINTVEQNGQKAAQTDDMTRKNNVIILKVPGAKVDLDPALDAAGRAALCLHRVYSSLPECQLVPKPNSK